MTNRDELLREATRALRHIISDIEAARPFNDGKEIPAGSTVKLFLYWDYVTAARATLAKIEAALKGDGNE